MRAVKLLGIIAVAAASSGCTQKSTSKALTPDESEYEMARFCLVECEPRLAADIVLSVVAASAPPGGPPPLGTLCADAGWRLWIAREPHFQRLKWVPSPLDSPDPDTRIKILDRKVVP
jgi:hypothetical protein